MKNIEAERNNWITQSNYFISKSRTEKLTLAQRRMLLYLISKVRPDDDEFRTITISQTEFMEICGLPQERYSAVREELCKLALMRWLVDDGKGRYPVEWLRSGKEYTYITNDNAGEIVATLSPSLRPYFLRLARDFTSLTLGQYISLKCRYAVPLYQFAMSKSMGRKSWEFSVPVAELKAIMGATHKRYCDFHSAALKPALADIVRNSDIIIEPEYHKHGKTVEAITFECAVCEV